MTGWSKSLGQSLALSQSSSTKDRGPKLCHNELALGLDLAKQRPTKSKR